MSLSATTPLGITKRKSPYRPSAAAASLRPTSPTRNAAGSWKQHQQRRKIDRQTRWFIALFFSVICAGLVCVLLAEFTEPDARSVSPLRRNFPRVVHFPSQSTPQKAWESFPFNLIISQVRPQNTTVIPLISENDAERLQNSGDYRRREPDTFETDSCEAMHPWQLQTFPTCNPVHEIDMTQGSMLPNAPNASSPVFLTSGYWRDVWVIRKTSHDDEVVLKTSRFVHAVTARNFDRNRRDSLVMERLTASPWVLDVYGFCANTGLSEYADGGDISTAIWWRSDKKSTRAVSNMTHKEQLVIGVQAALGLAELHNFDKEGQASVAHTDITPGQFVKVHSGRYKLQDFNRARFIRWNKEKQEPCTFDISHNPGKNRSPEEYAYKPETEKIDLYSLGNLFYMLLQKEWPFRTETTRKAQALVVQGYRPSFYEDVWNSTDPHDKALKKAMLMCHEQEPTNRSSARQVANFLKGQLESLHPGTLSSWGEPLAS